MSPAVPPSTDDRAAYNPSILSRIVLLVAATLLLALGAMMLVAFRGPPPHARPMMLVEAAGLLRGGTQPPVSWQISRYQSDRAPTPDTGQDSNIQGAERIAGLLGVPANAVTLIQERPPAGLPRPALEAMPRPDVSMEFDPGRMMLRGSFALAVRQDGGSWTVLLGRQGPNWRWYAITLSLMAGIFILLLLPAYWVARRITQPIRLLAEGAARERPERAEPLPIGGPPEVRAMGIAYNHMRARIAEHVSERTAMLVAIAHDLRTPMTRLSFRLEQLPDGPRAKAQADVQEMRAMVTDLLDFMREGTEGRQRARIDLSAIIETLSDDLADMGHDVAVTDSERAVIEGDALALRRCIGNMVENAVRYGGSARISLRVDGRRAIVDVVDSGPGVPPDILDRLCEPFYRGEASRNRETGGVGLGLSIARTIAEGHAGRISFANRNEGGLRATLVLPLEA